MSSVLMLVNEFWPLSAGGGEKQAERLAAYFSRQGVKVGVLTRGLPGLAAREEHAGHEILRPAAFGPGKLTTLVFMAGAALVIWRRRRDFDILHAHLAFGPALIAALMGRVLAKPVIVKWGGSGPQGEIQQSRRTWRGRLRLALLRRWVTVNIVLSREMGAELLADGFRPATVRQMVNGIDSDAFVRPEPQAAYKARLALAGRTVLVFAGRLVAVKALPVLLSALAQARRQRPELHLLLVGQGPDCESLRAQAQELELTQAVTFCGAQPDVRPYLWAADMLVLPSLTEGISNALLEGMAAGLPCIATAVGGNPEVLGGGEGGCLVPPNDVDALRTAIVRLASDRVEADRLGRAARARIVEAYAWSTVEGDYRELYQELMDHAADSRIARH
jgi:glycosyltransferase involved in cell wall biosynthesis